MGLSDSPVHTEVLGQERGHDHACPVVHPAGGQQLVHRRIHDGVAGTALGPRLDEARVFGPGDPVELAPEGTVCELPVVEQEVSEEVPPGDLRPEPGGSRARPVARRHDLDRRQGAPAQVLAETGGALEVEPVTLRGVPREGPGHHP